MADSQSAGEWATGHGIGLGFTVAAAQVFGQPATIPRGSSFTGTIVKRGAMESIGFYHEGGVNKGFMGMGRGAGGVAAATPMGKGAMAKTMGVLGRVAAPLYTGYAAVSGYQEEGLWGAAKGVGESVAYSAAYMGGEALLGSAVMGGLAGLVAIGVAAAATYGFGEAAQAHRKRLTGLEFGSPSVDMLNGAGALTSRARAMNALHSTHINARIAIGNEALLGHTAYRP